MRLVFLGLVLANIVLAVSAGLRREETAATPGLVLHGVTGRGESDVGLLVLVGEDAGGSAAAKTIDEAYSIGADMLSGSSPGFEEHSAIPQQFTGPDEPSVVPDAAASGVAAVASATDGRGTAPGGGDVAPGESVGSETLPLGSPADFSLLETTKASPGQSETGAGQPLPDTTIAAEGPSFCVRIGPFAARPEVGRLVAGLSDSISAGDSYTTELVDRPIFWVHVSPLGSTREAQAAQNDLAARGIESFVISDLGPLHNGVSLGVFRDPGSAQRLAGTRAGIGYPVAIYESLGKRTAHFARVRVPAAHAERLVEALGSRAATESAGASADMVECDEGFNARVAGADGRG